jgi:hypothetical protein
MIAPALLDRLLARQAYAGQLTCETQGHTASDGNLFEPAPGLHRTHGRFDAQASDSAFAANPGMWRAAALGFCLVLLSGAAIVGGLRFRRAGLK